MGSGASVPESPESAKALGFSDDAIAAYLVSRAAELAGELMTLSPPVAAASDATDADGSELAGRAAAELAAAEGALSQQVEDVYARSGYDPRAMCDLRYTGVPCEVAKLGGGGGGSLPSSVRRPDDAATPAREGEETPKPIATTPVEALVFGEVETPLQVTRAVFYLPLQWSVCGRGGGEGRSHQRMSRLAPRVTDPPSHGYSGRAAGEQMCHHHLPSSSSARSAGSSRTTSSSTSDQVGGRSSDPPPPPRAVDQGGGGSDFPRAAR